MPASKFNQSTKTFSLELAGIGINFKSQLKSKYYIESEYSPFLNDWQKKNLYQYELNSSDSRQNDINFLNGNRLLTGIWNSFYYKDEYFFLRGNDLSRPHIKLILSNDFRKGEVIFFNDSYNGEEIPIFSSGLSQIIFQNIILTQSLGLITHAAAFELAGRGLIFSGQPGAGKSTITKIIRNSKVSSNIISDDRVILKISDCRFSINGTPWPGELGIVNNNSLDLSGIFFIRHSKKNTIKRFSLSESVQNLVARSFVPLWNKAFIRATTDSCMKIAQNIPCYDFGFVPDNSVIDFLKDHLNNVH